MKLNTAQLKTTNSNYASSCLKLDAFQAHGSTNRFQLCTAPTDELEDALRAAVANGRPSVRGAMLPMPAPSSDGGAGGGGGDDGGACVLYGYKCDGDPQQGGWRFHPAKVMFDPRAACLTPPLGPFPDPQTVPPRYMGSLADVMNGGDDAQLARDGPEYHARKLRQFPAQEVVYELSVADFTSHVSAAADAAAGVASPTPGSLQGTYPGGDVFTHHHA